MEVMSHIRQFDHVGITVADLDSVTAFFADLGVEVEGRTFVEGEFIDTVIGIPDSRTEIVMLRPPDGGAGVARVIRVDVRRAEPAVLQLERA
jgi:catechol 2,3-dioxygenase-like lactoylglutathione lyase family enzyme